MTRKSTKNVRSKKPSPSRAVAPNPSDYQLVLHWSEEDQCYLVTIPAWQNAQTHGATLEKAAHAAQEVLALLIRSALKNGDPIPPGDRAYSGNLRLRLPVSLHGRLAREAEREGVSLNQWIVAKLAS